MNISDRVVSILRTVVPTAWGAAIAWLLATVALPTALAEYLAGEATVVVVTTLVIGLWYSLWRWLEPRLPAWLTRIVLGSNQPPEYNTTVILPPIEEDDEFENEDSPQYTPETR